MSFRTAIALTIDAINQRAANFRNEVVAVVVVALGVVIGAIMLRFIGSLAGLLAIVPVCGLFLWLDNRRVNRWRWTVLTIWARKDIDLHPFVHAVRANRSLPEETLTSMLALLGSEQIKEFEGRASVPTRQAVAAVVRLDDTLASQRLALKIGAAAIAVISVCGSAAARSSVPLGLTAAIMLWPPILLWLRARFRREIGDAVQAAQSNPQFDTITFRRLLELLPLSQQSMSAVPLAGGVST